MRFTLNADSLSFVCLSLSGVLTVLLAAAGSRAVCLLTSSSFLRLAGALVAGAPFRTSPAYAIYLQQPAKHSCDSVKQTG